MDFQEVLEERLRLTKEVLSAKEKEYASIKSRYHNFDMAARKRGTSPEDALMGMAVKHDVSIDDLVEWVDLCPGRLTIPLIREKIGDKINYLILLEGMLINRVEAFLLEQIVASEGKFATGGLVKDLEIEPSSVISVEHYSQEFAKHCRSKSAQK
jgi:hypothetical protein